MSNEPLSEADSTKLFNQISKAMRNDDSEKLASLFEAEEVPEEEDTITPDVPVEDEPEPEEEDKENDDPQEEEDTPADQDDEVDEEPEPKEPDELSKLKDQLDKLSKENHALRSQAGRVPHVQRRLQELDKKLEELNKRNASPSNQHSDAILEALKAIKETDPELASSVAEAIGRATSGVADDLRNRERDTLAFLREQEYEAYRDGEVNRLLAMYPNAPEVFKSATWNEWKKTVSPGILGLAESDNADDVSQAFELYANAMRAKFPELVKQETVVEKEPVVNIEAQKIEAERQRKKQNAAVVKSPSVPAKTKMPDDPDALFKKFSEQIRKDRSG